MSKALIKKVTELASELVETDINDELLLETAKEIESMKKFKTKDYDTSISHFLSEELELYKAKESNNNSIDVNELKRLEISKTILEEAKTYRRKYNLQNTSKIDTNILTANPFWAGGSRKQKLKSKEQGYIETQKGGIHRLTYINANGDYLTFNDGTILFHLYDLWDEQNKSEWLEFTEYQLLDRMNRGTGGKQYKILRDSLEKLRNTSIIFQEALNLDTGKKYVTERIPLIIGEKFTQEEDSNGNLRSKTFSIRFSDFFYDNIYKFGKYSLISLAALDELALDTSKGLYSMISGISNIAEKEHYIKSNNDIELPINVVYNHLRLENKPSRNKETVDKACKELENAEIIQSYHFGTENNKVTNLTIVPSKTLVDFMTDSEANSVNQDSTIKTLPELTN